MEIYNSVAAVISDDVFNKIPREKRTDLKAFIKEKGAELLSEGGVNIVNGDKQAVDEVSTFIQKLIHDVAETSKSPVGPEASPENGRHGRASTSKAQNDSSPRKRRGASPGAVTVTKREKSCRDGEAGCVPRQGVGDIPEILPRRTRGKKVDVLSILNKRRKTNQSGRSCYEQKSEVKRVVLSENKTDKKNDLRSPEEGQVSECASHLSGPEICGNCDYSPGDVGGDGREYASETGGDFPHESLPLGDEISPRVEKSSPRADESSPWTDESSPRADESSPRADDFSTWASDEDQSESPAGSDDGASRSKPRLIRVNIIPSVTIKPSKRDEATEGVESPGSEAEEEYKPVSKQRITKWIKAAKRNSVKKKAARFYQTVTHPLTRFDSLPPKSVLYVSSEDRFQCGECGYLGQTANVIKSHQYCYHSAAMPTCDICFKPVRIKCMMLKHRAGHFGEDGKLLPSSIILHKMKLKELEMDENLEGELLQQVLHGEGEQTGSGSKDSAVDTDPIKEENAESKEMDKAGKRGSSVQCSICFATLSQNKFLKVHMRNVHGADKKRLTAEHYTKQLGKMRGEGVDTQLYSCPKCDFSTVRLQNFTSHFRLHEQPEFFYCDVTGCTYKNKTNAEIRRHKRNAHSEKAYKCDQCELRFRTEPNLKSHVKTKHTREYARICEVCGKQLTSLGTYRKHMQAHHGDVNMSPGDRIMCPKCGRVFRTLGAFKTHQEKFHADADDSVLKEEKLVSEGLNVLHNGQLFQCKHCLAFSNTSARAVRQHIVRVHLDRKFHCHHCDQQFSRKTFLVKHIAVHHLGMEVTACPDCGKQFKNKTYVSHHRKRMHGQESGEHQCPVCHKYFFRKVDYEKHFELHKPEEERKWDYQCGSCERRFRFKSNLEYHMLEHTGLKAFECTLCKKKFKTMAILNKHMVSHSTLRPFVCPHCDKSFKQAKYLDIHLMSHATSQYACRACCRLFPHQHGLNRHVCKAIRYSSTDTESGHVFEVKEECAELVVRDEPPETTQRIDDQFVLTEEVTSSDVQKIALHENLVCGDDGTYLRQNASSSFVGTQNVKVEYSKGEKSEVTHEDLIEPGEISEILEDHGGGEYFILKSGIDVDPAVFHTLSQLEGPAEIRLGDQSYVAVPSIEPAVPSNNVDVSQTGFYTEELKIDENREPAVAVASETKAEASPGGQVLADGHVALIEHFDTS